MEALVTGFIGGLAASILFDIIKWAIKKRRKKHVRDLARHLMSKPPL